MQFFVTGFRSLFYHVKGVIIKLYKLSWLYSLANCSYLREIELSLWGFVIYLLLRYGRLNIGTLVFKIIRLVLMKYNFDAKVNMATISKCNCNYLWFILIRSRPELYCVVTVMSKRGHRLYRELLNALLFFLLFRNYRASMVILIYLLKTYKEMKQWKANFPNAAFAVL